MPRWLRRGGAVPESAGPSRLAPLERFNLDGRTGKAGAATTVGIASDASVASTWRSGTGICRTFTSCAARASQPRRPHRRSRRGLHGRHRKALPRWLRRGGAVPESAGPSRLAPLERFNLDGRTGEAGAASTVGIAKRCLGGFDVEERYRNLPDLHVLRRSSVST